MSQHDHDDKGQMVLIRQTWRLNTSVISEGAPPFWLPVTTVPACFTAAASLYTALLLGGGGTHDGCSFLVL